MTALLYAFLSAASTLAGGALPLFTRLQKLPIRYLLAFASGVIISTALFEMIPEAFAGNAGANIGLALGTGFFALYFIEKIVLIHACGEEECSIHGFTWVSVIGIALESLIDGIGIAAAFAASSTLGMLVAVAIIAHELPRGFSTAAIMKSAKYSLPVVLGVLAIDAFLTPVGVLLASFIPFSLSLLLAFTAGTFLYIGASDLLPEAHKTFNIKVVFCVLLGVVVVLGLEALTHGFVN